MTAKLPDSPALAAQGDPESVPGAVLRGARLLVEHQTEGSKLAAYVSIGIYEDGQFSMGFRFDPNHPFLGRSLFTAFVKEIIEREMTAAFSAEEYMKEKRHETNCPNPMPAAAGRRGSGLQQP